MNEWVLKWVFWYLESTEIRLLHGPTFLWGKFTLPFAIKVQFGLKSPASFESQFLFPPPKFVSTYTFDSNSKEKGKKKDSPGKWSLLSGCKVLVSWCLKVVAVLPLQTCLQLSLWPYRNFSDLSPLGLLSAGGAARTASVCGGLELNLVNQLSVGTWQA